MRREGRNVAVRPLLAAVLAYATLFFFLRPDLDPKTWEPGEIAAHILAGEGYSLHRFSGTVQPSANQEPAYTLLLTFFLAASPRPYLYLTLFQVVGWMACAVVLGRVAGRLIGAPITWTTFVVSLWPPLAIYVLRYHSLWLRSSALVLVIATAVSYKDEPRPRRACLLGLASGFAALVRAPFLLLPFIVLPWILWSGKRKAPPARLKHLALSMAVAGLVLSPWVARNRLVLGAWIVGTTAAGYTAIVGNHRGASGALDAASVRRATAGLSPDLWRQPEPARDAAFRGMVVEFWRQHPGEAISLYLKKLLQLWTWRPGIGDLYPRGWTVTYIALWCLCLPLILAGWRLARGSLLAEAPNLFFVVALAFSAVYALFAVNMRFRFESEPLLVPYALVAIREASRRVLERNGRGSQSSATKG